jgi:hypothetical protein
MQPFGYGQMSGQFGGQQGAPGWGFNRPVW